MEKGPSGDPFKVAHALAQAPSDTQGLGQRFKCGESVAGFDGDPVYDVYMKLMGSISTCTRRLPVTFSAEPSQKRT